MVRASLFCEREASFSPVQKQKYYITYIFQLGQIPIRLWSDWPWYNSWLGVKHWLTYFDLMRILIACSKAFELYVDGIGHSIKGQVQG